MTDVLNNMSGQERPGRRIEAFFHCRSCFEAGRRQDLAAGWTRQGIQVYCETCNTSVVDIDFRGQKVDYYKAST